jgi:23S rRNA pseudouridine2604 synthase
LRLGAKIDFGFVCSFKKRLKECVNVEPVRLSKLMAERGLCSRREADVYIERGWVLVDGEPVGTLGIKVSPNARIELDERAHVKQTQQATLLLNKPYGFVSSQPEKGYPAAMELLKPDTQWAEDPSGIRFQPSHLKGLAPAGRLDIDSQGLLVFTQDGRIARQLIGEASVPVEKEYVVRVEGNITPSGLKKMRHGMVLDGKPLKPAQVEPLNPQHLGFVLVEGRKRQIRRMCEMVGLKVTLLKRVRIGRVRLGDLPLGQWRYLGAEEKF